MIHFLFVMHDREKQEVPHVINTDNFDADIAAYLPTSRKGAYHACHWSGRAISVHPDPGNITLDFVYDADHNPIPAMPPSLFADPIWNNMIARMKQMDAEGSRYKENSFVQLFNINNIPLKPKVDARQYPELHRLLAESRDGLQDFFPIGMEDHNPGSNKGLSRLLRQIVDENGSATQYRILVTDVNPYHRMLKVSTPNVYSKCMSCYVCALQTTCCL